MPDCGLLGLASGKLAGLFTCAVLHLGALREAFRIRRMFNLTQAEIRGWLLNPKHPVALAAVIVAMLATIAVEALAR